MAPQPGPVLVRLLQEGESFNKSGLHGSMYAVTKADGISEIPLVCVDISFKVSVKCYKKVKI